MTTTPILLYVEETSSLFGLLKKSHKNERITQLIDLTLKLKKMDSDRKTKSS